MSSSPGEGWPRLAALFDAWDRHLPKLGLLTLACLAVAIVSGIVLAIGYDVRAASHSLALLELTSPAGRFLRAGHAWSSHALLVLAMVHGIEHLARSSERRLRFGVWVRVVLAIPLLLGIALTGFMLRGDAEGQLARQIVSGLLERLPAGPSWTTALLGAGSDLQLIYLLHAATLALPLLLVALEHGRRIWPSAPSVLALGLTCAAAGWLFPPALHDGADPLQRGPWYLVALQEALHWLTRPGLLWLVLLLPMALTMALPRLPTRWRRAAVGSLFTLLGLYLSVTLAVLLFRGPGWELSSPLLQRFGSQLASGLLSPMSLAHLPLERVPVVLDRPEGCLGCHGGVEGLGPSHQPKAVGCASCHLGDPFRPDAAGAHRGMLRVPGNLDSIERTCGRSGCHDALAVRVRRSAMATARGIVSVDRFVFGEQPTPDGHTSLTELGRSPADTHLAQLCSSCHLGHLKSEPGPITERSRGGGCIACHLSDEPPRTDHRSNPERFVHSGLTLKIGDAACFGCHSRSGRISLAYAGWAEGAEEGATRRMEDGRTLHPQAPDLHHQKGLACIDCHTAQETMGDGTTPTHQEAATRIRCATCHRTQKARATPLSALGPEPSAIVRLRDRKDPLPELLVEDRSGEPLTNARPLPDGKVEVRGKLTGKRHLAIPPRPSCTEERHSRLSCQACHSAWVPRCVGCHTQRDAQGSWVEYDVPPRTGLPTLGVLTRDEASSIEPFVPGMIMTLNSSQAPAPDPLPSSSAELVGPHTRFIRAYAFAVPHTTSRKGRSCVSCHLDPVALGLGEGRLTLDDGDRWKFEPSYPALSFDGLPADAWVGWGKSPAGALATRTGARPLNLEEQRRTLDVGACMGCHDPEQPENSELYRDYRTSREKKSPRCRSPLP